MKDCIEAKLFGICLESYTEGSFDFYLAYGANYTHSSGKIWMNNLVFSSWQAFSGIRSSSDWVPVKVFLLPEVS